MEYFGTKNLNMSFSGGFQCVIRKATNTYYVTSGTIPNSITVSTSGFNIQKAIVFEVKVLSVGIREDGREFTQEVTYRLTDLDFSSSGGVTTLTLPAFSVSGSPQSWSPFVSWKTRVTMHGVFLRCGGFTNNVYYNFDNIENTIDFTDKIPLSWTAASTQSQTKSVFLEQTSGIRIWSFPEIESTIYTSEIYANQKMVTLPIVANSSEILRLKCKQGRNSFVDVISKYTPNALLNKFVPVILTNGALKSMISSEYNEDEDGILTLTTTVADKITLGPLNEHGTDNPYYYNGGNLYYKTVVITEYGGFEVSSVKYNFTSFDSSTRKIVFSLDTSSYTSTKTLDTIHSPGDILTVVTGLSFTLSSFYGQNTTSPESNMVILKTAKLYTSDDVTVPTFLTLNYHTPTSFQSLMAWNGRSGYRSKVY